MAQKQDHPESSVAVITGASSGIGLAAASRLADLGWRLALAGRSRDSLERARDALAMRVHDVEASILIQPADVGRLDDVRTLIRVAHERFERIDGLVNNAGYAPLLPVDRSDPATIERAFLVNACGPAWAIHFAWPIFMAQKRGCIVNVSTVGTVDPFPGFFAYAASKAAVNLMARSCAAEGAEYGIRAYAVAPGAVETPMLRSLFDEQAIPPSACLAPEDVASLIVRCIDNEQPERNGHTITIVSDRGQVREQVIQC